jgi:cytochrome c-type biogenesis protein
MDASAPSMAIAFSAGFLSFVSPCVLPLVPAYVSFVTGLSFDELTRGTDRYRVKWTTLTMSLLFIAGFSTVFILFGASASLMGQVVLTHQELLRWIGGGFIIFFGLYVMGVFNLPALAADKRLHLQGRPAGYLGAYVVGLAFAAGWTPCVGPILGSILLYASTKQSLWEGVQLLSVYSLGLGLPLLVTALSFNTFLARMKSIGPYFPVITKVSGAFLIAVGILIVTNSLSILSSYFTQSGIGWSIGQ